MTDLPVVAYKGFNSDRGQVVTDDTLCAACGDAGEVDCRDCSGTGIGHGGHLCGTCLGAGAEPCPRCVRSKR